MTITLDDELEARLKERAREEGRDPDSLALDLLASALDRGAWEFAEAVAGIQRGLDASDAGRVRPAAEVFAEMRERIARAER